MDSPQLAAQPRAAACSPSPGGMGEQIGRGKVRKQQRMFAMWLWNINWNFKLQYISKFTVNCRREKSLLDSTKDTNKLDQAQWRMAKMVSKLKHFSVKRQEFWRRLQGTWAAAFHTPGVHREEVSRLAKWCMAGGQVSGWIKRHSKGIWGTCSPWGVKY